MNDAGPKIELQNLSQQEVETLFKVLQLNPGPSEVDRSQQLKEMLTQQDGQQRLLQLRQDLSQYKRHQPYEMGNEMQA